MHPFLSRASSSSTSITRCASFCRFFSSAGAISNSYNMSAPAAARDTLSPPGCHLRLKFGDFYKRFYSAMPKKAFVGGTVHQRTTGTNERATGAVRVAGEAGEAKSAEPLAPGHGRRRRRQRAALRMSMMSEGVKGLGELDAAAAATLAATAAAAAAGATLAATAAAAAAGATSGGGGAPPALGAVAAPPVFTAVALAAALSRGKILKRRKLHITQRYADKERRLLVEKSITGLTTRFLEHDRLTRELRARIKRARIKHRQFERRCHSNLHLNSKFGAKPDPKDPEIENAFAEEVDFLERTLRYISTHFYEPPRSETRPTESSDTVAELRHTPVPWFSPYLPPFPNYTSPDAAIPLNRALARLLLIRPPPPALIARICYNLLTSTSPPNIHTYNILIEGLTRVRHGSLAHIVFRNLVNQGLGPKSRPTEATIIRMLNLCVKTSDRVGFDKIVQVTSHRHMALWWGRGVHRILKNREDKRRSKPLIETMISGAARFGDIAQVRIWLRALKRECPESPEPGVHLSTSLIRLWTERHEWDRGLRCWRDLLRLDRELKVTLDLRAFRQMWKLCLVCQKPAWEKKVLSLATARGFNREDVLNPVSKTKGLWVRRENKAPHTRAQRKGMGSGELGVLRALEKASGIDGLVAWRAGRSRVSKAAKSMIWEDVIARRMDSTRPAEASGGDVREQLARRRQAAKEKAKGRAGK